MEPAELLQKIRKIEIKTRSLSKSLFAGEYHSAFKGKGILFDRVREYEPGDDIRAIDWNVTARLNHPYVKIFSEERELTVMLLIDVSASSDFGTQTMLKRDMIIELSAVLAFSALNNNDKLGVLFYSSVVEKFIPPKKGKNHILQIIREMLELKPNHKGTDLGSALHYMGNVFKKRCTAFIISDFLDQGLEKPLNIFGRKYDLIGLQIYDIREQEMPDLGLIHFKNTETGELILIDSDDTKMRKNYAMNWNMFNENLDLMLRRAGVDHVKIRTDQSYISPLLLLLRRRERKG